jgi:spore coat polysaccharide biosynthesis predicted glycosyltransferase SpsG
LFDAQLAIDSDIDALNQMIAHDNPALVIFDLLTIEDEPGYLPAIKHKNIPLIAITDDSHRRVLAADIVLNGNPNQSGQDYSTESGRYLLGLKYFIMDPNNGQALVKRPTGKVKDILLTFGGSDHNDLIFKVLAALEMVPQWSSFRLKVAVSSACGYLDRLRVCLKRVGTDVELLLDVSSFAPLWSQVDLAITAGGITLFERIASRLPGATVCQLQRQMELADKLNELGVNVNLGYGPELSESGLAKSLAGFISDNKTHIQQYDRAPDIIDGQGLNKFGDEIEKLLKGGER